MHACEDSQRDAREELLLITWGEEVSSLGRRGSMERTTFAIVRDESEALLDRQDRDTTGGHFISHTARSALPVSKSPLLHSSSMSKASEQRKTVFRSL